MFNFALVYFYVKGRPESTQMAHNNKYSKLKTGHSTLDIKERKRQMDFYGTKFQNMELASQRNFETTMNLAKELIESTEGYGFAEFNSIEEMYNIHEINIFNPSKSMVKFLKSIEYDGFRKMMVNFSCLVNDSIGFILFYTPMKIANPKPVSREFIVKFIEYHRKKKNVQLTYHGSPCFNDSKPVMCVESWHLYETLGALRRMYNNWSKCYLHLGFLPYSKACKRCLS